MTRNGKIARLPQPIREQINRRLENGEEGIQIAKWPEIERGKLDLELIEYKDAVADRKREMKSLEEPAHPITTEAWEQLEKDLKLL
jgi:hypothetical protein